MENKIVSITDSPATKICRKCGSEVDSFVPGRGKICRSCHLQYKREWAKSPKAKQTNRETKRVKAQERKEAGICTACGIKPLFSVTRCYDCLLKHIADDCFGTTTKSNLLKDKIEEQIDDNGIFRCVLCGDEISLGKNAQIGHYRSSQREGKTKFEAKKDTKNEEIHWLCGLSRFNKAPWSCNNIQDQFSLEEFETIICPGMYRANVNNPKLHVDKTAQQYIKICVYRNLITSAEKEIAIKKLKEIEAP